MDKKCSECKYWKRLPSDDSEPFDIGRCKRYPPTHDMMMIMKEIKEWPENGKLYPGQFANPTHESMWPATLMADWCGEFKPND